MELEKDKLINNNFPNELETVEDYISRMKEANIDNSFLVVRKGLYHQARRHIKDIDSFPEDYKKLKVVASKVELWETNGVDLILKTQIEEPDFVYCDKCGQPMDYICGGMKCRYCGFLRVDNLPVEE